MVDCTSLENWQGATLREFESHRLRQFGIQKRPNQAGNSTLPVQTDHSGQIQPSLCRLDVWVMSPARTLLARAGLAAG